MIIRFSTIITALLLITDVRNARILQITDVHLDNDYNTKGDPKRMCHRNAKYSGDLGQFGDYMCDSPKSLLEHLLEATAMIIPKPDLLLLTGDFTPHISYYNFDYVHKAIEIVTDFVQRYYKNTTVLPVMGNHDTAPPDSFPDHNGSTIYRIAYNLWKHWIGEQNMETFLNGGYYKYNWDEKAIIIVLNTNLYYRFNNASKEFSNETDPAGQFTFLTDTLREAQETGKTAHIVAHIAPGVFEKTPYFTWLKPLYNQILINITIKFAGTIGWMIFGHHHTDTFHIVTNSKMEPVQVYLIAPSVTPWFSSLPGAGSLNPAFRIYHLDDHSQQLTDAVTYWIDLKQLNKDNSTPFTVEYSMQAAYDIGL
uniref:Calcineurin-like phosphoesterase domain-containing protein n=1 Tax=Setaria digitata TaxID=48799 RepID=A0A915PF78_9BILA